MKSQKSKKKLNPSDIFILITNKSMTEHYNPKWEQLSDRNPYWKTPHSMHVSGLVRAFSDAILLAAPWKDKYLPEKFESIIGWISYLAKRKYKEEVINISPIDAVNVVKEWAMEHPDFRAWEGQIDTKAVFQNMAISLATFIFVQQSCALRLKNEGNDNKH